MPLLIALVAVLFLSSCSSTGSWRTASRESAGVAPKPEELQESIFLIYHARAYSWRGYFGIHPWVSWKSKDAKAYTVAQVTSWGGRRGGSMVSVQEDLPDRFWFGSPPVLIFEARGEKADRIIAQLPALLEAYPYKDQYRVWPGPNSNTFVDYVIRKIPELTVELPSSAIGKDYLTHPYLVDWSPTGTGVQMSVFGLLGFTLGAADGVEVNLLGMTFGVDLLSPAFKLPFVGRVGMKDREF